MAPIQGKHKNKVAILIFSVNILSCSDPILSYTRRLARYACFFLERVENVTNGRMDERTGGKKGTNLGYIRHRIRFFPITVFKNQRL